MFNVHILQKSQIPGNDHNLAKNEKNKTNTWWEGVQIFCLEAISSKERMRRSFANIEHTLWFVALIIISWLNCLLLFTCVCIITMLNLQFFCYMIEKRLNWDFIYELFIQILNYLLKIIRKSMLYFSKNYKNIFGYCNNIFTDKKFN